MFVLFAGTAYNAFENWNLNRLHPVPGKIYDVNGYAMHIYCTGSGAPPVILDSGLGNDWLIWQKVQPEIAKTNLVCSYDRAGVGWSAARPGPRDAFTIADQLHTLLKVAGVQPPLMLVGHSVGGLYARAFTALFPNQVAALVLVDASSPQAFAKIPSPAIREQLNAKRHREAPWQYFKVATGLARFFGGYCNPNTSQRIPDVEGLARAEDCRPSYINSWLGEWDYLEPSAIQVAKLPCSDSIPLVVVSQNQSQPQWDSAQAELTRLAPRSMRIIARNSTHFVMVDRPDVVLAANEIARNELHNRAGGIQPGLTEWR